jgi:predicted NBD/HSP70 family sugar kinase
LGDLLVDGLVIKEGRGASQGGRKPDLYGLAADSFFIVAIDLSKFSARVAIYNTKNEKVTEIHHLKLTLNNKTETIDEIHRFTSDIIRDSKIPQDKLVAIGITMPGLVDSEAGINHTYLKAGKRTLKEQLEKKFDQKVFIENDARAKTLAEFKFGYKENHKNVLGVFVDWGIGLGIIMDKKLYRGYSGFAGEFSHSPLFDPNGINCTCGKKGCLETVASGTAAVRLAKEVILLNEETILGQMAKEKGELDPSLVVDAALAGDQKSISILSEVGFELGKGIAILIHLLNPELIILGGSIAEAKNFILTPIQQALNIYCMSKLSDKTGIKLSKLGSEVGLQGAVANVNEHIFEDIITN